jgi:hypothetical protein
MWPRGLAVHSGNRSDKIIQNRVPPIDHGRSKYSFRRYRNTILALSKLFDGWFIAEAERFFRDHGQTESIFK